MSRGKPGDAWIDGALIAFFGLVVGLNSYRTEDLRLWDETIYLARGVSPEGFGPPGWEDSPLYSFLFSGLSQAIHDPVTLYFAGRAVSAILVVVGVYCAARLVSSRGPALAAASVAAVLPVSYAWPGVAGPAAACIALGLAAVLRWPTPGVLALSTLLMWIAAGMRPEFTWLCLALSVIVLAWSTYRLVHRQVLAKWELLAAIAVSVLVPLLVYLRYGNPLRSTPRQWTAFAQHFALRNATPGTDSWLGAEAVAGLNFPGATSITGALLVNPGAFAEHAAKNLLLLPATLTAHLLGADENSILSPSVGKAVAMCFVIGLVLAAWMNRRALGSGLPSAMRAALRPPDLVVTSVWILALLAIAIPQVVIYPRPHYLVAPICLILVLAAAFLSRVPNRRYQTVVPITTSLVGVGLLLVLAVGSLPSRLMQPPVWESSVRVLSSSATPIRVISVEPRLCVYISDCTSVDPPADSTMTMEEYLRKERVNAALLVPIFTESPWGALDGADQFFAAPERFGFTRVLPDSPFVIRAVPPS